MNASILTALIVLGANIFDQTFDDAIKAYEETNYDESIALFEQLVQEQVIHPDVFYNLGNAYYRKGRLGPAIANYERALHLVPGQEHVRENLRTAVQATRMRLPGPLPSNLEQSLLFWHYQLSQRTTRILAVCFWLTFWSVLALRLVSPLPYLRRAAALTLIISLAFASSAWVKAHPGMLVVANDNRVAAHYGTNENDTVRFELHEGDRVTADRVEEKWVRVITAEGHRGWALAHQLTLVGPPYLPPGRTGDTDKS